MKLLRLAGLTVEITFCVRGVLSPLLANLTLDGLERLLKKTFRKKVIRGQCYRPKVNFVRYADGTPVQMSNLRGASPLIPIVRSGI